MNQEIKAYPITFTYTVETGGRGAPSYCKGLSPVARFFSPKSLQQPSKNRPYFKKVSPRPQIRDSGAALQCADIHNITTLLQNIKP